MHPVAHVNMCSCGLRAHGMRPVCAMRRSGSEIVRCSTMVRKSSSSGYVSASWAAPNPIEGSRGRERRPSGLLDGCGTLPGDDREWGTTWEGGSKGATHEHENRISISEPLLTPASPGERGATPASPGEDGAGEQVDSLS